MGYILRGEEVTMSNNKHAYVTMLSTDSYLPGVLALFESIKQTNSKIENFVVVTNEDIKQETKDRLEEKGYTVISKPKVNVPQSIKNKNKILPYWNNTFDKFNIFDLEEYDKIVYLDSDIYVRDNIDELFDKPNMSAVVAGKSFPGNESWEELNSGVMVIEPKKEIREELIKKMNDMSNSKRKIKNGKLSFGNRYFSNIKLSKLKSSIVKRVQGIGDQDVIEEYFQWKDKENLHLDEKFNVFAQHSDYYAKQRNKSDLSCIHFTGKKKPWDLTEKELSKVRNRLSGEKTAQLEFFEDYTQIIEDEAKKYKVPFSLIIPMKNAEDHIINALDSIRNQNYENVETIVINDNSDDKSSLKVKEYQEKYPEMTIKLLNTQDLHRGPGGARNVGLDNATGSYILFLDADDKLNKGALEKISKAIALNPEADVFTLGYQLTRLDIDGKQVRNMELNAGKMQESRLFQIGANTAGTIWNVCARRSLFEHGRKLRFKENCKFEDLPTKVELFTRTKKKIKAVSHITHTQFSRPGNSVTGTLQFKDMKRLIDANVEIANLRPEVDKKDKMYINVRMLMMPVVLGWLAQKCIHNKLDLMKMKNKNQKER